MEKDFLEDYSVKEAEERRKYIKRLKQGKVKKYEIYPSRKRFHNLSTPIARGIPLKPPWVQIPQFGSTVIELANYKRRNDFRSFHGFGFDDLPAIVDFIKKTGKLQFVLRTDPIYYEGNDELDIVFQELKPPRVVTTGCWELFERDEFDEYFHEFAILSHTFGLTNHLKVQFGPDYAYYKLADLVSRYVNLKLFGFHEICDEIEELLIRNPKSVSYLVLISKLILGPKLDPLKAIYCENKKIIIDAKNEIQSFKPSYNNIIFPYDVGVFLNNNLKLITPKNIEGAIELNDLYSDYKIQRLITSLNNAVINKKFNDVNTLRENILESYENVWNDAKKINNKINYLKQGITLGLGILGNIATSSLGSVDNILASLGFTVLGKLLTPKSIKLSEKILAQFNSTHLMEIYDFQKRHKLF